MRRISYNSNRGCGDCPLADWADGAPMTEWVDEWAEARR